MIPNIDQCKALWDKYQLPQKKRVHVSLVADVAILLAQQVAIALKSPLDITLLRAGALLHDLDKNIERLPGEFHPHTAVRVLRQEGMGEVAALIQYHSVQYIDDPATAPKTWEEKLLFLADKMVGQEVITVDKRFDLWLAEVDLAQTQKEMLRRVYPKVKLLEQEVFTLIQLTPYAVAKMLTSE